MLVVQVRRHRRQERWERQKAKERAKTKARIKINPREKEKSSIAKASAHWIMITDGTTKKLGMKGLVVLTFESRSR